MDKPPTTTNGCPGYDTKQSDGEIPVMLELGECGVPLHWYSGLLWPGEVAPDRALSIGLMELIYALMQN